MNSREIRQLSVVSCRAGPADVWLKSDGAWTTGLGRILMRNIRLDIAYDGTDFFGWQRQPNVPTIQACLESALERIVGERIALNGSGRTDAGVHAMNQVANFKTGSVIPVDGLMKALNNILPSTVRITCVEGVAESFHARYGARSKTYRYRILCAPVTSPFLARFVYH
jgi:tRNA pseudouridine38-40 synthase